MSRSLRHSTRLVVFALTLAAAITAAALGQDADRPRDPRDPPRDRAGRPPTLTVTGVSESAAAPDRAFVRAGAVVRADSAAAAQDGVNRIVQAALEAVRAAGVEEKQITTTGLSLAPVYGPTHADAQGNPVPPRLVGFEARNTITAELADPSRTGPVIDAMVKSGANEIQGVWFDLRDDTGIRGRALRDAVNNARAKANAIAEAMGTRISGVVEVTEGGAEIVRPMRGGAMARGMAAEAVASTPVQPGQVKVNASVTIVYAIDR